MLSAIIGFAVFSAIVAMTPGSDTLLVLRNCLRGGRRAGSATALGAAVGSLAWAVAVAFGLAAVLQRWDAAFTAVRLAGAAYLVVLGVQALWEHRGALPDGPREGPQALADHMPGAARGFRQGLVSCLLNPKVGIFFVAVVPQFLPQGRSALGVTLLFGVIDAVIAAAWLLLVAVFATRAVVWLRRPRVTRVLERTAGGVLIALGAGTAAESL